MPWIVDKYCDRITLRSKASIGRDVKWNRFVGRELIIFDTELEAWEFATKRAESNLRSAESALSNAKRRLKKCESRRDAAKLVCASAQ